MTLKGDQDFTVNSSIETNLFSDDLLKKLSIWEEVNSELEEKNLIARSLRLDDYRNGYLELLSELTVVGDISKEQFESRFQHMLRCNQVLDQYLIVVIEDVTTGKIVGASTLFLELKFIRSCSMRGRLEDVCVLNSYRGKNVGSLVVRIIAALAKETFGCYKLTLDCTEDVEMFYKKIGFNKSALQMSIRY